MYGKIFDSIYDGTLRSNWQGLITFQQLIILADKDGVVDMTPHAISGRTGIPLEIIEAGLDHLSKPDPYSRSSTEEGRRIVLLEDHRPWGWRLVNHGYYNKLRSAEEKREADRTRVAEKREKTKVSHCVATSRNESQQVAEVAPITVSVSVTEKTQRGRFTPPSLQEIRDFLKEKKSSVIAEEFHSFYESKDWMIGKNKMKNWRSAVATWESRKNGQEKKHDPFQGAK